MTLSKQPFLSTVLLFLVCSFLPKGLKAAPGDLDLSFGSDGLMVLYNYVPIPSRVRVQPDGKILTVANSTLWGESFLSRSLSNGLRDTTFGGAEGLVYFNDYGPPYFMAFDLVITHDGKYVVTGYSVENEINYLSVYRFNSNGSVDGSFGNSGRFVLQNFASSNGERILLTPEGKYVVAGSAGGAFLLAGITKDGSLDTTFGTNGIVQLPSVGVYSASEIGYQPDGTLSVAISNSVTQVSILRFSRSGTLDMTFGIAGRLDSSLSNPWPQSMAIQPDGKIVVCGRLNSETSAIRRYQPNGTTDIGFGAGGTLAIADPSASIYQTLGRTISLETSGKVVLAGSRSGRFALARSDQNGAIDSSFGTNGFVFTLFGTASNSTAIFAQTIQPDGKLLTSGAATVSNSGSGMIRYLGDTPTSSLATISGRVTNASGAGIRNAIVSISDQYGSSRYGFTNPFGYYSISNIQTGATYSVNIRSKRYVFNPQTYDLAGSLTNVNFVATN